MDGIVTVLNTPFTALDEIDIPALQRNAANAVDAGVSGFLVGGLAGEVAYLSESERVRILKAVQETVNGRASIIGGAYGNSAGERLAMTRRLVDAGCDGVMASIPFTDPESFKREVRDISEARPGFLMIQDWDPGGSGIPMDTIVELFETVPEFTWLKIEVAPAGPKYSEVLERTGGRLKVAGGWAVREMIDALDRGVHAFMPTALHRVYTRIYDLYQSGRREEARDLFEKVLPVLHLSNRDLDMSIRFFKRLLKEQGIYCTDRVRVPCPPLDAATQSEFDRMIELAIELDSACRASSSQD